MTAKRITPIRWIAFLLALMLLPLGFLSAGQAEDDFEIEGTTLKRYRGKDETVVVPDGIEVLGSFAFDSCEMKQVILPETLTAIENCCFFGCPSLEEILPVGMARTKVPFP